MREAAWAGASSTQKRSLIPSGMPQRSGASPCFSRAAARLAWYRARSGVSAEKALSAPEASAAARLASVSSTAPISPARSARRASAMVRPEPGHSTTFGTAKKPARASGAFASTLSGMPPSLTTSSRQ